MGLLARALGSVKGRVEILPEKAAYAPGDVVSGTVRLNVTDEVDADRRENIWYRDGTGDDDGTIRDKSIFLDQAVVLNRQQQTYAPGEYLYPFEFTLAPSLPAVFHLQEDEFQWKRDMNVSCEYELTARLKVLGSLANDLVTEQQVLVRRPVRVEHATPKSNSRDTTEPVFMLCCFNVGSCTITASIDRDVLVADSSDTVKVKLKVANLTSSSLYGVDLFLHESLTMHLSKIGHGTVADITVPYALSTHALNGVEAGVTAEYEVEIAMSELAKSNRKPRLMFASHFVTVKYFVVAKCAYSFSQPIELWIPVKVVSRDSIAAPPATPAAMLSIAAEAPAVVTTSALPNQAVQGEQ